MQNTQQKHVGTFPSETSNNLSVISLCSISYAVIKQGAECLETVTETDWSVRVCARACMEMEGGVKRKNLNTNDYRKQRLERNMPLNSAHSCTFLSVI